MGPLEQVRIVLVRPRQPKNVGVVARAIANHGIGGLTLVAPAAFDPEVARWAAPGATDVIDGATITATVAAAVADSTRVIGTTRRRRRWEWPIWGPAELVSAVLGAPGPTALLFGPEDSGLSNDDLGMCQALLRLPTSERGSLNLAQAVTVCCAALRAGDGPRGPSAPDVAVPIGLQAALIDDAMGLLLQAGYLRGRPAQQVRGLLTRMLGRTDVVEAGALRSMVRNVQHLLTRTPD